MNVRDAAIAAGELTYRTSKPCRRGHVSDRYSSNGMCIQCLKERADALKQAKLARAHSDREAHMDNNKKLHINVPYRYAHNTIIQSLELMLNSKEGENVAQWIDLMARQPLTAADLVPMFDWRNNKVNVDVKIYPMRTAEDGRAFIFLRNAWYVSQDIMDVLQGQRDHAVRVWE